MLGFEGRGKPEYPEKNLSELRREPEKKSTHILCRVRESIPSHIGGFSQKDDKLQSTDWQYITSNAKLALINNLPAGKLRSSLEHLDPIIVCK